MCANSQALDLAMDNNMPRPAWGQQELRPLNMRLPPLEVRRGQEQMAAP